MLSNLKWNFVLGKSKFFIDNTAFWYVTSFTTVLYIFCACLLTLKMMTGGAIKCEPVSNTSISIQMMEDYCLASGTYTLVEKEKPLDENLNSTNPESNDILNVAPWVAFEKNSNQKRHYHRYYGLVLFYLLVASVFWYLPKLFWTHLESNRISNMCSDEDHPDENMKKLSIDCYHELLRKDKLVTYFFYSGDWHFSYVTKKVSCEALTVLITIILYFGACKFLDNYYWLYGFTVITYWIDPEKCNGQDPQFPETYPIIWDYFPLVTKCSFHDSGSQQATDLLCILNYNKISGYIFLVFSLNYIICAILSGGLLIFRVASISSLRLRQIQMTGKVTIDPTDSRYRLITRLSYPQFLVLMMIRRHCNMRLFDKFLDEITMKVLENEINDIEGGAENERSSIDDKSIKSFDSTATLDALINRFISLMDEKYGESGSTLSSYDDSGDSEQQENSDENCKQFNVCMCSCGCKNPIHPKPPILPIDSSNSPEEDDNSDAETETKEKPVAPIQNEEAKNAVDIDGSDEEESINTSEEKKPRTTKVRKGKKEGESTKGEKKDVDKNENVVANFSFNFNQG